MTKKPTGLFIFVALIFTVSAFAAWNEYRPQGGQCLMSVPKTPEYSVKDVPSDVGTLKMHQFMMDYGEHAFLFTYTDYPTTLTTTKTNDNILEDVVKGSTEGGQMLRKVDLEIDGHPGKEYVAKKTDFVFKGRAFLVKQRLFQLIAVYPPTDTGKISAEADEFLTSFRLLH